MNKSVQIFTGVVAVLAVSACTTPRYAYHAVYTLTGCDEAITTENVAEGLAKNGFYRNVDRKGPYSVFHKPNIVKKGPMAVDPYENQSGELAVAVCNPRSQLSAALKERTTLVLTEEWLSCKNKKDCTEQDQKFIKKLAENWKCQVQERSGHSQSWKLEERQDWTADTCQQITTQLSLSAR
jgi:hypothetical protein